jgi:hypothetical protein
MPIDQPGARDVHVDKLLTNISVGYKNEEYIADQIFPTVMVEKQSDLIASYDKGDWLRAVMQPHAPGTVGARSGYKVDTSKTYFCKGWKLGKELPDDVVNNADQPFRMFEDVTDWLNEQARLRWELEFATNYFAASKGWQDKVAGTDFVAWDNVAGSNPITDLRRFGDLIRQKTGRKLNKWVFSQKVWNTLVDHPLIVDRIKHTSKDSITPEILAGLVGYNSTHIGSAIYAPNEEGLPAASAVAEVWGNHALGLFTPERPSLFTPAGGYIFIWRPITNTKFYFRRLKNEEKEITILEIKSFFDMKQIDGDSGVFLQNCIS